MGTVLKTVERMVTDQEYVTVCDGCGKEHIPDHEDRGFAGAVVPPGWYIIARPQSGINSNRKEACSQACAISVVMALEAAEATA